MTLGTIAKIRNITSTLRVRGDLIGDRPMAANHIFGRGNPVPTATATLVAAILVISAMPVQGQQPSADQLKAYAENTVKIIGGDKQKIETYCELNDLTNQLDQAVEEKDTGRAEELSQKAEELLSKLGPEFAALADGINGVHLSSQDAREIGSIIGNLNEHCDGAQQSALIPRL
jgi:hypothetical protein